MNSRVDLACAWAVLLVAAGAVAAGWWRVRWVRDPRVTHVSDRVLATALPTELCRMLLAALQPVVRTMLALGVSANAVTLASLLAGIVAGCTLGTGHFGIAGVLFVAASCGDALDGLVARASHTESPGGALFDASVDRYEEFFAFAGLAIFFRSSELLLTLTLVALAGSFMVSYGSAQAEARHIRVPPGLMRRPERATCLGLGIVLGPIARATAPHLGMGAWLGEAPVVVAMSVIAVVANVCAVRRIRAIAEAITPRAPSVVAHSSAIDATPLHVGSGHPAAVHAIGGHSIGGHSRRRRGAAVGAGAL